MLRCSTLKFSWGTRGQEVQVKWAPEGQVRAGASKHRCGLEAPLGTSVTDTSKHRENLTHLSLYLYPVVCPFFHFRFSFFLVFFHSSLLQGRVDSKTRSDFNPLLKQKRQVFSVNTISQNVVKLWSEMLHRKTAPQVQLMSFYLNKFKWTGPDPRFDFFPILLLRTRPPGLVPRGHIKCKRCFTPGHAHHISPN